MLSSDPRFEIESAILPLVFALNSTGVFQSCWSCEGHDVEHQPRSAPSTWFYCEDFIFAELLTDHIYSLSVKKALHLPWQVELLGNLGRLDVPVLQLKPQFERVPIDLSQAQKDVRVLAEGLVTGLRERIVAQIGQLEAHA